MRVVTETEKLNCLVLKQLTSIVQVFSGVLEMLFAQNLGASVLWENEGR